MALRHGRDSIQWQYGSEENTTFLSGSIPFLRLLVQI